MANNDPLILTFDCGTQSTRALLFDKQGNIVGKAQKNFEPYYSLQEGWAEQEAQVYKDAIAEVSRELGKIVPERWDDIIAVTTTTFRDTGVCMGKDGGVLRPIILWLDTREVPKRRLPLKARIAVRLVGMKEAVDVQSTITKSNWIIDNEPEIWAKTYKYMLFSGFVTHFLTGKFIDSSASQVGHIPFHYKKKKWKSTSDIQYNVFNVPPDKLCDLKEPGEILGHITKEFAQLSGIKEGLPVVATGSDKGCETLGCGVVFENMASLSLGTTATIQFASKKYVEPQKFLPAYPAVMPGQYNPEIQIYRGYWMISWFKKEFAQQEVQEAAELGITAEDLLNRRLLNEVPAGCHGLLLQPLWSPMLKNPEGRGIIAGFSGIHTRKHIYRAIIEGIGFALIEGMNHVTKRMGRVKIETVTVSGGGSQSDEICQITADMFGVPVKRIQTYEACGLGSSLIGFAAMKEFANVEEGIKSMVHYKHTFLPDKDNYRTYCELYEVYKDLYKNIRPTYIKMHRLQKQRLKKGQTGIDKFE